MKKMRGVADPITLGLILVALGAGIAVTMTPDKKAETAKAQVEAPQVVVSNTAPQAK